MTKQRTGRGAEQISLRLPPGFRDAIRELADRHGRSVNSEIIAALRWHIGRHMANEEDTRRELLGLVQEVVDIVNFERDRHGGTDHLARDLNGLE